MGSDRLPVARRKHSRSRGAGLIPLDRLRFQSLAHIGCAGGGGYGCARIPVIAFAWAAGEPTPVDPLNGQA